MRLNPLLLTVKQKAMDNIYNKEYYPGKGYKGYCPVCELPFYGKADKKYHSDCKVAFNNQKAAEKNAEIKDIKNAIQKADTILKSFRLRSIRENGIPIEALSNVGFDFNLHTRNRIFKNGWIFYYMNIFAFCLNRYKTKVFITRISQLEILEKINI